MILKSIYKAGVFLTLSSFLFGCSSSSPIQKLIDKRVALASGINFETAKVVTIDPTTGEEVLACTPSGDGTTDSRTNEKASVGKSSDTKANTKCTVELILNESNPALRTALELSRQQIQGEIKKNGKVKPARFVITVTTLYEGSDCNVIYSGGNQYENCAENER